MKMLCPYCGGRCEVIHEMDGNPYHRNHEKLVCRVCGRTISKMENTRDLQDTLNKMQDDSCLKDMDESFNDVQNEEEIMMNFLDPTQIMLKITAIAQGGGVQKEAETFVSIMDGTYDLGNNYPFGRRAIDHKPPFSLCDVMIKGNEIYIAGEVIKIKELPKSVTKKLIAYGYGYVPWEEIITIKIELQGG